MTTLVLAEVHNGHLNAATAKCLTAALALIEPAILIIMGIVVVFILISLYLPIFSLGQASGGQG